MAARQCTLDQVVNFMAFCVTAVVFMDLFDISRFYKTAQFSLNIMARAVSTIGGKAIVQVVTYNEATSKKGGVPISSLGPIPCAVDCVDLLLHDIYQFPQVCDTIEEGKKHHFTYLQHNVTVFLLRGDHEILRPRTTWFAMHFLALKNLCQQAELMYMFTSSERVNSDFTKDSKITKAQEVPHIVLSEDFRGRAENIIYIAEPLVRVLKSVDGNLKATFSHVCDAIDRAMLLMKERIRK